MVNKQTAINMKYTNIKKLLIKFMGGELINFPTRFLRWIKIDGDSEDDGSGEDNGSGDVTPSQENILDVLSRDSPIKPVGYAIYLNNGYEFIDTTDFKELKDIVNFYYSLDNLNHNIVVVYNYDDYYESIPEDGPLVRISFNQEQSGLEYLQICVHHFDKTSLYVDGIKYMQLVPVEDQH